MAFAAGGKAVWRRDIRGTVFGWETATGKPLSHLPGAVDWPARVAAWSSDGCIFVHGQRNGLVLLASNAIAEPERRFRLWVTAPDFHLHAELAEQADKDKQPFAFAFRVGRYLASKSHYANSPRKTARLAGWLGLAPEPRSLLAGLPVHVKSPYHEPPFPDAIACTGVLYKDSGIAPARLLIGTSRALAGDPSNWLNHAFHGGALYRNGEPEKALTEFQQAVKLHGKPSPLTHNLLALTYLAMGQKDKAQDAVKQAAPAKDAPWEDVYLHRLLQPEVEAAQARGEGEHGDKEK